VPDGRHQPGPTGARRSLKLRKKGVVSKFVEFYGRWPLIRCIADVPTLANRPQYGRDLWLLPDPSETCATCGQPAATKTQLRWFEAYAKENGPWRDEAMRSIYNRPRLSAWIAHVPAISRARNAHKTTLHSRRHNTAICRILKGGAAEAKDTFCQSESVGKAEGQPNARDNPRGRGNHNALCSDRGWQLSVA